MGLIECLRRARFLSNTLQGTTLLVKFIFFLHVLNDRVKELRVKKVCVAGADATVLRRKTVSWFYGFLRFDRAAQDMILLALDY